MNKSDSSLVLITNHFPYGIGEAFLESEIDFLTNNFEKVIVLSKNTQSEHIRYKGTNFFPHRIATKSSIAEMLLSGLLLIKNIGLSTIFVIRELRFLRTKKRQRVTVTILSKIFHDLLKSLLLARLLNRLIKRHKITERVILYSYWLNSSALATCFVRHRDLKIVRISRAHRNDLYEEESPDQYLTFRSVLVSKLDCIYAISAHGKNYLQKKTGAAPDKVKLSRLGTMPPNQLSPLKQSDVHQIVSCSFLKPVKRIDLLIQSLLFTNSKIHWTHFGDGPLYESLNALALQSFKNSKNITFSFYGAVKNKDLLDFYRINPVALFINTSANEGIPVSIMEAQSFGIPVAAMAVGGIPEILNNQLGRLISTEATPEEIGRSIDELLTLPIGKRENLQKEVVTFWATHFNATINYPNFVNHLNSLIT